ncbi:carboxymethylenebutenolidase [Saccharata proteae CBS 121410]|uniref:Carboxymethylenebutenolidase n=1 Tax=Saccharata proteae CBS 121410 TaxID=1314787 RepID=A0A9P4LXS7_9PEZI|nr:carboxymethylenebutenolidase [Saccharata proteae CBS 121410]
MPLPTGTGFLSFNSLPPRLHLTAETDDFDPSILAAWRAEGFDVTYHPLGPGGKAFANKIKSLPDDLELGEYYALMAYGESATLCLQLAQKPMPRLCALVCYYPTRLPSPGFKYPSQLRLVVHLAGEQTLGAPGVKSYWYRDTREGFAESDVDEYDEVAAGLSWSRSLGVVRKGFGLEVDLEDVWEGHVQHRFATKNAEAAMGDMVPQPYVNNVPVATGGIGRGDLYRFYRDFFMPSNPTAMNLKLVSRTMGVDRVVDEMVISFRHAQEVPWMLPGVPPTNKPVKIAVVSVVCLRGGKLYSEHMYWDQASVLVQIGLLDAKLVPKTMKDKGMERLPVMGAESAQKILSRESVPSNKLIPKW